MGFLDHSTNNIIIDAVLTDFGRQRLAENSGQFRIEYFTLGDDEVDYGLITKFGRTVGKEKITKNTPIFEAQTRQASAIKNKMLTLPNPREFRMPRLTMSAQIGNGVLSGNRITVNGTVNNNNLSQDVNITVQQKIGTTEFIPGANLTDSTFTVFVNDRFLTVDGTAISSPEPISRITPYAVIRGGASTLSLTVRPRAAALTSQTFATFGLSTGGTTSIVTPVTVVGDQTGLRLDIQIQINQA